MGTRKIRDPKLRKDSRPKHAKFVTRSRRETRRDQERAPHKFRSTFLTRLLAIRLRYRQRPGTCRPQVDQNHPALPGYLDPTPPRGRESIKYPGL